MASPPPPTSGWSRLIRHSLWTLWGKSSRWVWSLAHMRPTPGDCEGSIPCVIKEVYCWIPLQLNYRTLPPSKAGPAALVCMLLCAVPSFAVLPGVLMCVSYMGELTAWIVFPTVAIRMYRSSPLVPLDSCLTAVACLSSACQRMFIRCVTSKWFGVTSWVCSLRGP